MSMDLNDLRNKLPEFKKGAKKGDRECQYWLGFFYFYGHKDIQASLPKAIKYFKKAAAQGSGKASHMVGYCYKKGGAIKQNNQKAQQWFTRSIEPLTKEADNGDFESVKMLGHAYHTGSGVPQDPERGVQLLQHAANNGNTIARSYVAGCYEVGDGVEKDIDKAVDLYQQAAAEGNPLAQDELGHWYLDGENVERNVDFAIKLFNVAMENGCLRAKRSLAGCYEEGNGVEKDLEKAIQLYTEVANGGSYVKAFVDLGYLYRNKLGDEASLKKAFEFFREAVRRGDTGGDAEDNLAYSYEHGLGVKKNPRMAVKWYHRSIQAGNEDSSHCLDQLIEKLKTRAYQQDKNTLKALAYCYHNGVGVSKTPEVAAALLHPNRQQSTNGYQNNPNEIYTCAKKCVCCEERLSSAVLVHGATGHACFCLPCALTCSASGDNDDDSVVKASYCPICRASIDKVILLLPSRAGGNQQEYGQGSDSCMFCGKNESNATILHGETGHRCCCYECAYEAKKQGRGCPICFELIDGVIRNYYCI